MSSDPPAGFDPDAPMVGTPDEIAADVGEYADAGATRLDLKQEGLPIEERVAQLRRFREDVLAHLTL